MNTSPELQRAGRRFVERLIRENGPEAAAILRRMADDLDEIQVAAKCPPRLLLRGSAVNYVEISYKSQNDCDLSL